MKKYILMVIGLTMVSMLYGAAENDIIPMQNNDSYIQGPYVEKTSRDTVLGTIIFEMNDQAVTGNNRLLGIEFDGQYFYLTGGGGGSGDDSVWVVDTAGNVIWTLHQPTSSVWGWRDVAWDGVYAGNDRIDTLYASSESGSLVHKFGIDLASGVLNNYGTFSGPVNPCRALAYKPDSAWFFTANWSPYYKFSRTNPNIQSVSGPGSSYGAAYDTDPDEGGWVWWHSQLPAGQPWRVQINQMNANTMAWTGVAFGYVPSGDSGIAGGLCFHEDFRGMDVLFTIVQGTPVDLIVGLFVRWHGVDVHDVGMVSIDIPSFVPPDTSFNPQATVTNFGTATESFDVTCTIDPGAFSSTFNVVDLAPDETLQVTFPDAFVFAPDTYTVTVYTELGGDEDTSNDTLEVEVISTGIAEWDNKPTKFMFSAPAISRQGKVDCEIRLPEATHIDLSVYSVTGSLYETVISDRLSPGTHVLSNDIDLPTGIYFFNLKTGSGVDATKKVLVVK
jgi:hypothetical protein